MIKVGIVGGTGYTGVELLRLLAVHPDVELTAITSRKEDGLPVADMFPSLRGRVNLKFSSPENADLSKCDVVFFATPHGVAMAQAPELLKAGVKVIDLAADFRIKEKAVFEKWYKIEHTCPDLLEQAAYGLAELNREDIKQAKLVANPGCYPTTMQLGYYPLLKAGVVDAGSLIADCKSGVSGAGRKAEIGTLFSESSDNFKAYGVAGHRHTPETSAQLQRFTSDKVSLVFTPHLVPMIRGMHSTLYARLTKDVSNEELQQLFEEQYKDSAFVDVMPFGSHPETRSTRGSNMLRLALHRPDNGNTVIVLVVQDNLVKGASGQAVQCMNLMFGLEETTGLTQIALLP
ncbi:MULTISPECIES: N-acetyl-gamma-glutamyl-phosphate reductase [unclassified Duganella]|uniref:N-acetyl-gamma-glutamyl-phosphate reductase n=1 Tax=unclassified Duganella TaxID=2636909 RepID=UPI00088D0622|nr:MULTISPECIES: N-acetyl-gamma-glutamyl-phosphate reductase [unclassified Duganella]SDG71680.1 N-acetyl-gamma-glutamyl-phosphate reductase [Duganella sp. OV458]SDJ97454.1 N-acetyl-gamma-glutamyl-phosphate reductase [Duganella sp. OV510]